MNYIRRVAAVVIVGGVAYLNKTNITTIYLKEYHWGYQIQDKIPDWYHYNKKAFISQRFLMSVLFFQIERGTIPITEKIFDLISEAVSEPCTSYIELKRTLPHKDYAYSCNTINTLNNITLYYNPECTCFMTPRLYHKILLYKHPLGRKIYFTDKDNLSFYLLREYPQDINILYDENSISDRLCKKILKDIESRESIIPITPAFAECLLNKYLPENKISITKTAHQKLLEKNPSIISHYMKDNKLYLADADTDDEEFLIDNIKRDPAIREHIHPYMLTQSLFIKIFEFYKSKNVKPNDIIINMFKDFKDCRCKMLDYVYLNTDITKDIIRVCPELFDIVIKKHIVLTERLCTDLINENPSLYEKLPEEWRLNTRVRNHHLDMMFGQNALKIRNYE